MSLSQSCFLLALPGLALLTVLLAEPAQAEPKAIDPLRVMSFNIRYGTAKDGDNSWSQRAGHVYSMLRQRQPDLIGLQECLDFQLRSISSELPDFDAYALGRDAGGGGEMCAILWRRERFELIDSGTLPLHPDGSAGIAAWDAALPRICFWVQLHDKRNDRSFWLYNAHLDHVGEQARLESAQLMLRTIAERNQVSGVEMPVILLGDFNCKADSAPYLALTRVLQDCYKLGQFDYDEHNQRVEMQEAGQGTFHDWTGKAGDRRIDHILSSRDFSVLRSEIIHDTWTLGQGKLATTHYLSDHFPVLAEIYWE